MSYPLKLMKTVWFGVKNNKVMAGFTALLCILILPAFSVILEDGHPTGNTVGVYGCIVAYFCGIILPIAMFGYLHNGRECEFYNAMPVRKSQYFWGYFIAGFLIFLIPVTLMFVIQSAMGNHGWDEYYFGSVAAFLSLYCSSILAVVFSGSTASTIVTLIIRNGLAIALVALPLMIAAVDVNAYVELLFKPICILTPVTAGNEILDPSTSGVHRFQLIAAAIELLAAFFLHRYRRNETVTALAFPGSRYFYQYTVMLIFALGADALMLPLFNSYDSHYGINTTGDQFPLVIFLTVLVIFISFILMNMVLEKNSKAAFKRIRHFFFFTAGYGVLVFAVSGIGTNLISPSVLPFRPQCAIIRTYTVEQVSQEDDYDFTFFYTEDNDDYATVHFYKEIPGERFAVINPQSVKLLVKQATHPSNNFWDENCFGILKKDYKYPFDYGAGIYVEYGEPLPDDFILFSVEFIQSDKYNGADAIYNYNNNAFRWGFSSGIGNIIAYKDFDMEWRG